MLFSSSAEGSSVTAYAGSAVTSPSDNASSGSSSGCALRDCVFVYLSGIADNGSCRAGVQQSRRLKFVQSRQICQRIQSKFLEKAGVVPHVVGRPGSAAAANRLYPAGSSRTSNDPLLTETPRISSTSLRVTGWW